MELAVGASEATIKSLLSKLGSLLAEEYALVRGVRGDIQFINDELASMQAFLGNLSNSTEDHDSQTKDWMKQVRDVSYDIEDCVDDFAHGLRLDPQSDDWLSKIRGLLYEMWTWNSRRRIAAQIADLKERAHRVGERRERYGVNNPATCKNNKPGTGYTAAEHQETTHRLIGIKKPVGMKAMAVLEEWIKSEEEDRKDVCVLSIFGFGGVGKTASAMALFQNCSGVQFTCRAMVTVSHNTDHVLVLDDILRQVRPQANNVDHKGKDSSGSTSDAKSQAAVPVSISSFFQKSMNTLSQIRLRSCIPEQDGNASKANSKKLREIQTELEKHLQNKRYLLLIDDVWSSSTLQNIWKNLPKNTKGSRIIVTTRFEAVTKVFPHDEKKNYFHKLEVLLDDEAEELFSKSLSEFTSTEDSQPSQNGQHSKGKVLNDKVPDRVWKMCGGLPLALITMSGAVASNKQTESKEWLRVCRSLFPESQVCRKPEEFMRIINYSYSILPSEIKTCALYLSIFPKGRKISRKRLIRRWIAEGFVSEKQGLSVEDVAETCFNQLIKRKIIRPVEHSSNGRVKTCQVHDMILEYIISKAEEENFVTVVGGQWPMSTRSNKVRRMSLHGTGSKHDKKADKMNLSHVRSLTVFESMDQLPLSSFKTGIVQVLDLEGCRDFKANLIRISDICEMTLLKYLSLRGTDIRKLPSNIGDLKYLETLDIRETEVHELPKTVFLLERISSILGGDKKTRKSLKLPKEIKKGAMKALRILSGIEIADGSTALSNPYDLTRLKKLVIYKLPNSDLMFDDLISSIQYFGDYSLQTLVVDDESSHFLDKLDAMSSPPYNLRALELSGKLFKLPKWVPLLVDIVKLTISATALRPETLLLLRRLNTLFSLTFSVCATKYDPDIAAILHKNKSDNGGEIFVPVGGFAKLKLFCVFVPLLPSLNFSEGAMPVLERLELRFKRLDGLHGMGKLESLHDLILTIDGQAGNATNSIVEDLKEEKGNYTLVVNDSMTG